MPSNMEGERQVPEWPASQYSGNPDYYTEGDAALPFLIVNHAPETEAEAVPDVDDNDVDALEDHPYLRLQ
ncbi:hypothetical protein H4R34_003699 [Dimargaris verticillata]|uniref:Uncharacterized protein n=1 Tax=Dimargaris verticillata TaxID=2761393 RepID=A0A9W8B1M5_9FUNG|nr:hypothetical protein H4R34_003699 [Dimargaris verticillata]